MRKLTLILLVGFIALLTSCRKDFDTVPSSGGLEFSKQTVYLDTIFTNISSSTYMLKVYNRSNDDISIPAVRLEKGDASKYRIMVDGMTGNEGKGKYFPNVEILAKDSLFIFIETTVNIAETEPDFTYNDRILFDTGSNEQAVNLVTLIQDAHFIFPNRDMSTKIKEVLTLAGSTEPSGIVGHTLLTDEELHWQNDKPYVVYGYAHVPEGRTLVIDAGAKVHFHDGSGIIVDQGAMIKINGLPSVYDVEGNIIVDNEVRFEGDRLEPRFSETPGQWTAILMLSQLENEVNHLTLKNSVLGFYLPGDGPLDFHPKLKITNSQIYNSANFGIYGTSANITGENVVINFAGQSCFAGLGGGTYSMTHCTFNNNWQSTEQVSVWLDNYSVDEARIKHPQTLTTSFKNSIIYGSNRVQVYLDIIETTFDQDAFKFCLFKFNDSGLAIESNANYNFIRTPIFGNGIIKEQDPLFFNRFANQLQIPNDSPAAGTGSDLYSTFEDKDIYGDIRPAGSPDLGAYIAYIPN